MDKEKDVSIADKVRTEFFGEKKYKNSYKARVKVVQVHEFEFKSSDKYQAKIDAETLIDNGELENHNGFGLLSEKFFVEIFERERE